MTNRSWAVVVNASSVMEAQKARLRLTAAGIPVDVWDANLHGLYPWLSFALGGVRVVVPPDRAEEAREVLAATDSYPVSDEELTRQALEAVSEAARRRRIRPFVLTPGFMLAVLIIILAIVFLYGLLR